MPGSTPRLLLPKPIGSESMALGDNQISDAWSKIDAGIGCTVVATVAAIGAPFLGDAAYESTTGNGKCYNGVGWTDTGSANTPLGSLDYEQSTTVFAAKVLTKIMDTSFVAAVGRRYLVHYAGFLKYPSGYDSDQLLQFRWKNGGTTTTSADTLTEQRTFDANAALAPLGQHVVGFFEFFPNVAATVALGMYWNGQVLDANNAELGTGSAYTSMEVMEEGP